MDWWVAVATSIKFGVIVVIVVSSIDIMVVEVFAESVEHLVEVGV